ncbi:MAG: hypothetical protein ACK5LL_08540 [Suipraeoptans sp.]
MSEKVYKTMGLSGATGIVLGIVVLLVGIAIGTISIVMGTLLIKRRKDLTI